MIIFCFIEKIKDVFYVFDLIYLNFNFYYVISKDYKILFFFFRLLCFIKELMMFIIFWWVLGLFV